MMNQNPAASDWAAARGEKWRAQLTGMESMLAHLLAQGAGDEAAGKRPPDRGHLPTTSESAGRGGAGRGQH